MQQLGFAGGRVLEAGCGSGNFIGFAPRGARVTGVELDPVTASIAARLYPDADIANESFADTRAPEGSFDLAIGNVPFGNFALTDGRHNPGGHSIHNHFIIKSLHLVRPGGLVAVVTSRYTMDARNPAARREIAALADLAGAVRLPSGAHQQAAGTKVITDLLIFRRREPGRDPDGTAWEQTRTAEIDGVQVPVNEYFLGNPGAVLGEMRVTRGAYSAEDLVVAASGDTTAALARALARIAEAAPARGLAWTAAPDQARAAETGPRSEHPDGYLEAHRDGTFTQVAQGHAVPFPVPGTQAGELRHLLRLRDAVTGLLDAEAASREDTPELDALRRDLNRRYDDYVRAYGTVNRFSWRPTGRPDPDTGGEKLARIRPPQGGFRSDPFAPLVQALEEFDPVSQTAAKAAIFTSRVIAPRNPRLGADNGADALAICLDVLGEVRLDAIARLLGTGEDQARRELGTLAFDDPGTGRLIPAAEYLSGKVRDKLEAAERAAADDPRYDVNAEELRKVIPADLMPSEIDARLGASWIDASHVRDFLAEILADPGVRVEHPGGQVWTVRGNRDTVLATSTWGTSRYPAPALAQAILEQRRIEVRDKIGGRVLGPEHGRHPRRPGKSRRAGRAVPRMGLGRPGPRQEAGRRLQPAVQRRRAPLLRRRVAVAARPGAELRAAPAPGRRRRPDHPRARRRAVPRGRRRQNRRDDHGRDGTAPPQAGQQALHRGPQPHAGAVQPRVPPALPPGRILVTQREDLQADRRRQFVARCATGDWDAVIMSRSAFERIPMSADAQSEYLERRSGPDAGLHPGIQGKRRDERQAAARRPAARRGTPQEEAGLRQGPRHHLRGHRHRLPVHRRSARLQEPAHPVQHPRRRDRRVDARLRPGHEDQLPGQAQRQAGGHLRHRHPDRQQHHRSVRHAALPAPRPAGIRRDHRLRHLGRHLRRNGRRRSRWPPKAATVPRQKTRFARFTNVPEMLRRWHVSADIKTAEDLKLPVPALAPRPADGQRAPETVVVQPSEATRGVHGRTGRAGRGHPQPRGAPRRRQHAQGQQRRPQRRPGPAASLDEDLWQAMGEDLVLATEVGMALEIPGKISVAADRIHAIWDAHRDDPYLAPDDSESPVTRQPAAGLLRHRHAGDDWNVYDELRDQLTARGMPPA